MKLKDLACILAMACPFCGAVRGEACKATRGVCKGEIAPDIHMTRVRRFWTYQREVSRPLSVRRVRPQ